MDIYFPSAHILAYLIGNLTINTKTKIHISYMNYKPKIFSLGVFVKKCLNKKIFLSILYFV